MTSNNPPGSPSGNTELSKLVKRIANINQMVYAEYDMVYSDGSGNTSYDIAKLHDMRKKAIKHLTKEILALIDTTATQRAIEELEIIAQAQEAGATHRGTIQARIATLKDKKG